MTHGDTPDLLGAIVAATRKTVESRRATCPAEQLAVAAERRCPRRALMVERLARRPGLNVIAECKRRSPSRGVLRDDYDAADLAERYQAFGAAAISVLTEPAFFDGSLDDLRAVRARVGVPLLRKDFIVDEYQLLEARAAGADAVLLIAAALERDAIRALHLRAHALGLAALVEVHSARDLELALQVGPELIGVNTRNLRTLQVDRSKAREMIEWIPDAVVAVAESGLQRHDDLCGLRELGYDAFLVGESLVAAPDPGLALDGLLRCS
jgi:indole-3-glycerol phosphate synthase